VNAKRLLLAAAALSAAGCSWFTDFRYEPKIKPWEEQYAGNDTTPFRGQPEFSVPITGNPEPAYLVSHSNLPATIDSMAGLVNPHVATPATLDNGRKYYQINCAVCHGAGGAGDGRALRYGVPAPTLLGDITKNRTDGYIWGMMRNGRGLMPTYNRIEDSERWDVVLYVRALQGKIPGVVADTSPAGTPGQNGRTVPGFTRTAPTRAVPYRPQDMNRQEPPPAPATTAAPAAPAKPARSTP
jgi:mono/diheme cytochrome c family protein